MRGINSKLLVKLCVDYQLNFSMHGFNVYGNHVVVNMALKKYERKIPQYNASCPIKLRIHQEWESLKADGLAIAGWYPQKHVAPSVHSAAASFSGA